MLLAAIPAVAKPRRARLVLLVLALALVAVAIPLAEPMWWWATRVKSDCISSVDAPPPKKGWCYKDRWTGKIHGRLVMWYEATGTRSVEAVYHQGVELRATSWNPDGTVLGQRRIIEGPWQGPGPPPPGPWYNGRDTAPWWWGVEDETEPTAPWIGESP